MEKGKHINEQHISDLFGISIIVVRTKWRKLWGGDVTAFAQCFRRIYFLQQEERLWWIIKKTLIWNAEPTF